MQTLPQSPPAFLAPAAMAGTANVWKKKQGSWLWAIHFIFILSALKLLASGIREGLPLFVISKPIDVLLTLTVIGYTLLNIDYYIRKYPYPSLLMLLQVSGMMVTELLNKGYLLWGMFNVFKFIIPFLFLFAILRAYELNQRLVMGWIKLLVFLIFVLSAAGLAILPPETNRGETFLPAYFLNLHTSAYVLLMAAVCVYYFAVSRVIPLWLALVLILYAAGMIIAGWGVRTAMVSMVAFAFLEYLRRDFKKWLAAYLFFTFGLLLFFTAFLLFGIAGFDYDKIMYFSSGRLGMWAQKFSFFFRSTPLEMLFGHGAGSDFVKSDVWLRVFRDSHNDYLRLLTEDGVFGLTIALAFLVSIHRSFRQQVFILPLIAMYMVTSAFSNGMIFRPVPAQIFVLAVIALLNCAPKTPLSSDRTRATG